MIIGIILTIVLCILALIVTIKVGMKPQDETYDSESVKNVSKMSWIYVVGMVLSIIATMVYVYVK